MKQKVFILLGTQFIIPGKKDKEWPSTFEITGISHLPRPNDLIDEDFMYLLTSDKDTHEAIREFTSAGCPRVDFLDHRIKKVKGSTEFEMITTIFLKES